VPRAPVAPAAHAPSPPPGWRDAVPAAKQGGVHVLPAHLASIEPAAHDVATSTTYARQFGETAPPQASVADRLQRASAWAAERERAHEWAEYVDAQSRLAWDDAFDATAALRPSFETLVARNRAAAKAYPGVVAFFAARGTVSARAHATRAATRRARATAAPATPAASATPAPPATPADPHAPA
jgi:hypothetical protein